MKMKLADIDYKTFSTICHNVNFCCDKCPFGLPESSIYSAKCVDDYVDKHKNEIINIPDILLTVNQSGI